MPLTCLLKGVVIEPDGHLKTRVGRLARSARWTDCPSAPAQPAAAVMDAETSERDPERRLARRTGCTRSVHAAPAPASRHRRGGRYAYEDSLDAHGYQRYRLKCTFHASCLIQKCRWGSDVALQAHGARSFFGSLAIAWSRLGDQAATFEIADLK